MSETAAPWEEHSRATLLASLRSGNRIFKAAQTAGVPYPAPDRTGAPWEPEELALVTDLHEHGVSTRPIARLLGRALTDQPAPRPTKTLSQQPPAHPGWDADPLLAAIDHGRSPTDAMADTGWTTPNRVGHPWHPSEVALAVELLHRGASRADMSTILGRSPSAIGLRLVGVRRRCPDCGNEHPRSGRNGRGLYLRCTPCQAARDHTPQAIQTRTCPVCDTTFTTSTDQAKYCSRTCNKRAWYLTVRDTDYVKKRAQKAKRITDHTCTRCQRTFQHPAIKPIRYCSPTCRGQAPWTPEEEATITRLRPTHTTAQIAEHLGRTPSSVRGRIATLARRNP